MKKLLVVLAVLAMTGIASADLVMPNADFHLNDFTGWATDGVGVVFDASAGYGIMDESAGGGWGVLVANDLPAGLPIAPLGLTAGQTYTFTMDMIALEGAGDPGIKFESWGSGVHISNSGDIRQAVTGSWVTYSWDYTIAPGADALKLVPLWGGGSIIGYDNLSVVPEPATMALLGLGGLLLRRRRA